MTLYSGVTFKDAKTIFGDRTSALRATEGAGSSLTIEKGDDPRPGLLITKTEGGLVAQKWVSFDDVSSLDFYARKVEGPALVRAAGK